MPPALPDRQAVALPSLGPVTVWETSFANVNPIGGLVYGGAYKGDVAPAGSEQAPVEVRMLDYTRFCGNMNWVVNDPTFNVNNNVPDYLITLTFNTAPMANLITSGAPPGAPMTWYIRPPPFPAPCSFWAVP